MTTVNYKKGSIEELHKVNHTTNDIDIICMYTLNQVFVCFLFCFGMLAATRNSLTSPYSECHLKF